MIRTALLDPKGQRSFPDALLAGGVEVPETRAAMAVPRDTSPNEAAPEQVPADAATRPVMRRAMYPK